MVAFANFKKSILYQISTMRASVDLGAFVCFRTVLIGCRVLECRAYGGHRIAGKEYSGEPARFIIGTSGMVHPHSRPEAVFKWPHTTERFTPKAESPVPGT